MKNQINNKNFNIDDISNLTFNSIYSNRRNKYGAFNKNRKIIIVAKLVTLILTSSLILTYSLKAFGKNNSKDNKQEVISVQTDATVNTNYESEINVEDEQNTEDIKPIEDEDIKPIEDEDIKPIEDEDIKPIEDEDIKPIEDEDIKPVEVEDKNGKYKDKTIYLTFDDGPSRQTAKILKILDKYDVKATFFVVGKEDKNSIEMYKEIHEKGHTLAMHSYSHKYNEIYKSLKNFKKDFNKISNLLHNVTGEKPTIYRFPGGSLNDFTKTDIKLIIKHLNENDIAYYDWNVLSGDAEKSKYSNKQLIKNVIDGVEINNTSIVLLHDADDKESTVKTLPQIIEKLLSEGARILPLDNDSPKIQMIKADKIR